MRSDASGRLLVLTAAILFSTGGAVIKAVDLPAWQIAGSRSGIAFLSLLVLLPASRRGWSWRCAAVGASYAGTLVCYALANRLTTAANTIFLQSTAPLYVLFLAPWLLGERLRRADLIFMMAMVLGLLPFFLGAQASVQTAPNPAAGNVLAAAAGLLWALTVVGLRWLSRQGEGESSGPAVAIGNLMAFLVCLPMAVPLAPGTATDWLLVVFLGVVQIAVAYVFLIKGLRRTLALEASLLLLLELVLNPIWAWLLHDEIPAGWPLAGGALILVATGLKSVWEGRAGSASRRPAGDERQPSTSSQDERS